MAASQNPDYEILDYGSYFTNEVTKKKESSFKQPYAKTPNCAVAINEANVACNAQNISFGTSIKADTSKATVSIDQKQTSISSAGCTYFVLDETQYYAQIGSYVFKGDALDTVIALIALSKDKLDPKEQNMVAWIQGIDFQRKDQGDFGIRVRAEQKAPYQFALKLVAEGNVVVNEATIGWCAYDETSGLFHGEVSNPDATDESNQFDDVKWPTGVGLQSAPKVVLYGWTGFKASKDKDDIRFMLRFKMSNVSAKGADYELSSQDHSVVKSAFAFYLAMGTSTKPNKPEDPKEPEKPKEPPKELEVATKIRTGYYDPNSTNAELRQEKVKFPEDEFSENSLLSNYRFLCSLTGWHEPDTLDNFPVSVDVSGPSSFTLSPSENSRMYWAYIPKELANNLPLSFGAGFQDIAHGEETLLNLAWADDERAYFDNFKPYDRTPQYVYWIENPGAIFKDDLPNKKAIKIINATKSSFDLEITWQIRKMRDPDDANNMSYSFSVFSWLPREKNDFISGEFDVQGGGKSGTIDFSAFKLKSPPIMIGWGPTEFEIKPGWPAFYVDITDFSTSGAKWNSMVPDYAQTKEDKAAFNDYKTSLVYAKISWVAQRTD